MNSTYLAACEFAGRLVVAFAWDVFDPALRSVETVRRMVRRGGRALQPALAPSAAHHRPRP